MSPDTADERPTDDDRPVMVYDADCGFCVRWVQRWRERTGPRVEYAASHAVVGTRFPHVSAGDFAQAVYLFEPDGRTSRGAEAALRAVALGPGLLARAPLFVYTHIPGVRPLLDTAYGFIARNRLGISRVETFIAGPDVGPSTWLRSRRVFQFAFALVALLAVLSARAQILGLAGSDGILPIAERLADRGHWTNAPTWLWLDASDAALTWLCTIGVTCAGLIALNVLPGLAAAVLWTIVISLIWASPEFFSYQWDNLLAEVAFVAALYLPWHVVRRGLARDPPRLARWLMWFVLFRLTFESGVVKIVSDDPTWAGLTALNHHYMTQPLPHVVSWFVHKAPDVVHQAGAVFTLLVELVLPFTIFAPRRLRHLGAVGMIALQVAIFATGNFGWFNLLTIALCLSLFDDVAWRRKPRDESAASARRPVGSCGLEARELPPYRERRAPLLLQRVAGLVVAAVIVPVGSLQVVQLFVTPTWPTAEQRQAGIRATLVDRELEPAVRLVEERLWPFRVVNSYGLFATMTTTRPEIRIEVADEAGAWHPVEFAHKPFDAHAMPRWSQPHLPRLDWQLWFEALLWERTGQRFGYQPSPWFVGFLDGLAEARPAVLGLLAAPTLDGGRPTAIRIRLEYARFTTLDEHFVESGDWWRFDSSSRWITTYER